MRRLHVRSSRSRVLLGVFSGAGLLLGLAGLSGVPASASVSAPAAFTPASQGNLDCNGYSTVQKPLRPNLCADVSGSSKLPGTWGGRFYDNGNYIGHDEPDATFLSSAAGSGNNVTWTETLGKDPHAAPGNSHPGKDVSHWFELSPAPWFSMDICDPQSFPQAPCTPESDSNAPTSTSPGAGSAFMELQFYPPGNPPFVDSPSCDDKHWCAALTIDSLTATTTSAPNPACPEPINAAFIQTNGVPTGPPSPQDANLTSSVPNAQTLLMNPGDTLRVHMSDAPAPGGGDAFEAVVNDLTTGKSGFMQASAANGFMNTNPADCSGSAFNFQPEFNTAAKGNISGWTALQTDISTQYETGHFIPCTSLADPIVNPFDANDQGGTYNACVGPYENTAPADSTTDETGDAVCYYKGDTHPNYDGLGTNSDPAEVTNCQDNIFQNGDLDFDGSPYWPEWPTSLHPNKYPGSFLQAFPTTSGSSYPQYFFQTDLALSEATCQGNSQPGFGGTLAGCTVPPPGPGKFYPYWSTFKVGKFCALEFGNVAHGFAINNNGKDKQYGTNQEATLGYPEFEGPVLNNTCTSSRALAAYAG